MGYEPHEVVRLDTDGLRAIAHPLRARLMAALRIDGAATASQLAARLGTNSGQTSYHLRVLADVGLVVEQEGIGTARERWWDAAHRSTTIDPADFADDAGAREQLRWLQANAAVVQDRMFATWVDEKDQYGPEWDAAAGMSDWQLHVTPAELSELHSRIADVVTDYVDLPADRPGAERVIALLRLFPQREIEL